MYKVGDVVLITRIRNDNKECFGKTGVIKNINLYNFDIEFKFDFAKGHGAKGHYSEPGRVWCYQRGDFLVQNCVVELI